MAAVLPENAAEIAVANAINNINGNGNGNGRNRVLPGGLGGGGQVCNYPWIVKNTTLLSFPRLAEQHDEYAGSTVPCHILSGGGHLCGVSSKVKVIGPPYLPTLITRI